MLENCIIKNVTMAQREILKKMLAESKLKESENNQEGWIDNVVRLPHISFFDNELSGFAHAVFFEPQFEKYSKKYTDAKGVLFDDFVKEFA